jgi:hypothetical protein
LSQRRQGLDGLLVAGVLGGLLHQRIRLGQLQDVAQLEVNRQRRRREPGRLEASRRAAGAAAARRGRANPPRAPLLWELAVNRPGRLGYCFVEEASLGLVTSRQLRDRAAFALPAAVGLDLKVRDEVEALLLARLDDASVGAEHQTALAQAAAGWDGLSSVAASRTAWRLVQAMKNTKEPSALKDLGQRLSAVSARLEPREAAQAAAQAAAIFSRAIKDTKEPLHLSYLAKGLSAVSARLVPKEAAQAAAGAAAALTQAMKDTKLPYGLSSLAKGLAEVSGWLEPKEAAQAAATLTQAIKGTKDPVALRGLAEGLSAVSARLEPREAAAILTQAMQAMKAANEPYALAWLAPGLSAVSDRLEPREAAQVAATLTRAMKDTKHPLVLRSLAQGLSAVSTRLEPREAAAVLTQAMKDIKDWRTLKTLAEGLSAVTVRLESKEAARAAAILLSVLMRVAEQRSQPDLVRAFSLSLTDLPPATQRLRNVDLAIAVAATAGGDPFLPVAFVHSAAQLRPCRLSTQQLVELLKLPTCVGEGRRVVLDHLGNRYRRPFADAWEFVRFAQEQRLDLDFTSRPEHPE